MAVINSRTGHNLKYFSTGNEYITLSRINESGGIMCAGFLDMEFTAHIDFIGRENMPLISPFVYIDEKNILEKNKSAKLLNYWLPEFEFNENNCHVNYKIVTPITRRGFICVLEIENKSNEIMNPKVGLTGAWSGITQTSKLLKKIKYQKNINNPSDIEAIIFSASDVSTLFSMCILNGSKYKSEIEICDFKMSGIPKDELDVCYNIYLNMNINPKEKVIIPFYIAFGRKEITSISAAKELMYQGHERLTTVLLSWLERHIIKNNDNFIQKLINENSFYNFFNSQGITLDTEEMVIVSSRDSKSFKCGIYSDFDSMCMTHQAVEIISWSQARKHLEYVFNTQAGNTGVLSRNIKGNILEVGIVLSSICAPIRALIGYVKRTNDLSILYKSETQDLINYIQDILSAQYHPNENLLETLYTNSGTYSEYPYICMQNVLVWRILNDIGELYNLIRDIDRSNEVYNMAEVIKSDIFKNFVIDTNKGQIFAYATDLKGFHITGDDPYLSFSVMSYLDFCKKDDPIYLNTLSFLEQHEDNLNTMEEEILKLSNFALADNRIIVDKIINKWKNIIEKDDTEQIETLTSDPYASLSGRMVYALFNMYGGILPKTSYIPQKQNPTELLYHRPPQIKLNSKKARA